MSSTFTFSFDLPAAAITDKAALLIAGSISCFCRSFHVSESSSWAALVSIVALAEGDGFERRVGVPAVPLPR